MISHNNDRQVHEIILPFLDSLFTVTKGVSECFLSHVGTVMVPFGCEIVKLDKRGNVELLFIGGSISN